MKFKHLVTGSAAVQILNFAQISLLFALFTPASIGANALVLSISSVAATIITLRLEFALYVIPKGLRPSLILYGITVSSLMSMFVLIVVVTTSVPNAMEVTFLAWLYANIAYLRNFSAGANLTAIYRNSLIIQSLIPVLYLLFLGLSSATELPPLPWLYITAAIVDICYLGITLGPQVFPNAKHGVRAIELMRLKSFWTWGLASVVSSKILYELPIWSIAFLFGPSSTAIYSAARQITAKPVTVLAKNYGIYILGKYATTRESKVQSLWLVFASTALVLSILALPLQIYEVLVHQSAIEVKAIIFLLAPMMWARFIAVPLASVYQLRQKQRRFFALQLAGIFALALSMWLARDWSFDEIVLCIALTMTAYYLFVAADGRSLNRDAA